MQLQFEDAWQRTIAPQDRQIIEELFKNEHANYRHPIIRVAINHRKQLLVSVLVQNHSAKEMIFMNRQVQFHTPTANRSHHFTIKSLKIPPYTSMPWTFIFEQAPENYSDGQITIATP
ncbi:SLAP domain-containing protein [Kurthia sibirica]|uniref:SLAP domain-containing protein n=1 Tax=Kurthia sibirica TaxID=202750 RepID=A0A2U3APD3_9BACL|nr:SLAP domain-containing protein [Kurthia sibirica]PWI26391.1 SLAP domain-containing protein [Kurthia sibirica]GEK34172.1 hypothetical protein KSI01_17050 [Kurthia sibirica]